MNLKMNGKWFLWKKGIGVESYQSIFTAYKTVYMNALMLPWMAS